MVFFEWSSQLETGIGIIDIQHRKLIDIINSLAELSLERDQNHRDQLIEKKLTSLIDYTNYHFHTEEEFFKKINYADADAHVKSHESLRQEVSQQFSHFAKGDDIHDGLLEFLKTWLQEHILGADMKYVNAIKEKYPTL